MLNSIFVCWKIRGGSKVLEAPVQALKGGGEGGGGESARGRVEQAGTQDFSADT